MVESLDERIARVTSEKVSLAPYNPEWPLLFEEEKQHLLNCLPDALVVRIEHFGSTAIPDMPAKPIVDMLVEVASLQGTRAVIAPILEEQGYDYFWRPIGGDDVPPYYAWFIKRDELGVRSHHIHMVEKHFEHWDGLLFRDYLIEHDEVAAEYGRLKHRLNRKLDGDRIAYTLAKSEFVMGVTALARQHYGEG